MKKCSALTLLACVFALLTAERVAAAPVTWDFVATSCNDVGCDPAAQYPVTVATLTLTGPDSTGSASWPFNSPTATFTGDSFSFDFDQISSFHRQPITSAFIPPVGGCQTAQDLCDFNLSWVESGGLLTAVKIDVLGFDDDITANLFRGEIASMGEPYAPCTGGSVCEIFGSWVDSPSAVPEPGSLALLASAFGVWGLIGQRRVLHAV